jgi:hypothetical protein
VPHRLPEGVEQHELLGQGPRAGAYEHIDGAGLGQSKVGIDDGAGQQQLQPLIVQLQRCAQLLNCPGGGHIDHAHPTAQWLLVPAQQLRWPAVWQQQVVSSLLLDEYCTLYL